MRELKYHEKKLLKKVDFLNWKKDSSIREIQVLRRYHIQNRDDYSKYNKLCGQITKLVAKLKVLKPSDPFRIAQTDLLLTKLYNMALIPSKSSLSQCEKLAVSSFCRRRLPVILCQLKMAETMKEAVTFIEQGHIKVGVETVTDPAFHVNRNLEDHVTWVKTSSILKKVKNYNNERDDFDLVE